MLVLLLNMDNREYHVHMFGTHKGIQSSVQSMGPETNVTSNYFSIDLNLPYMCMSNSRVMTELTIVLLVTHAKIMDWV